MSVPSQLREACLRECRHSGRCGRLQSGWSSRVIRLAAVTGVCFVRWAPCLGMLLCGLALCCDQLASSDWRRQANCERKLAGAIANGDWERAELLSRKCARFGATSRRSLWLRYLVANQLGDERQRRELQEQLMPGSVDVSEHLVAASRAVQLGDWCTAREFLEQAYVERPHSPAVCNNLAWCLVKCRGDAESLQQALWLSEDAVRRCPDSDVFRDTLVQIQRRIAAQGARPIPVRIEPEV